MALLGEVSSAEHRLVVVFDEFQDILEIDKHIDRELRGIGCKSRRTSIIFF